MSTTTPTLSLPYPELGDDPDVPRDIKALADRLDGLLTQAPGLEHPIQVIDPNEADFGWNDFRRGWDSGGEGTSGPNKATDWGTGPVMNAAARWKFTAPCDGVLSVSCYWLMGYNNLLEKEGVWQEFMLSAGVISGSVSSPHPDYARWRREGGKNDKSEIMDTTLKLATHFVLSAGAVVSPYIKWRGKVQYEDGTWRPKWSGGRMQGLFIPGRVAKVNPPSNNSNTKDADARIDGALDQDQIVPFMAS